MFLSLLSVLAKTFYLISFAWSFTQVRTQIPHYLLNFDFLFWINTKAQFLNIANLAKNNSKLGLFHNTHT